MPLNQLVRQTTQAVAGQVNSHRILLYSLVSTVAVCAAIANALKNYSNFYSVAIYLSKSSRSVLILANFAVLLALLCGHMVQKIFFGTLRPNEVERLYDRLWFFITESLLAFTIFRDEFDIPFALMFGFLLFVKSFHWLAGDRIEWMDQRPYPGPSLLFHVRMSTLFVILWATDFIMFLIAVENTITHGVGGMVLFASEYGILMASVANTISKYLLSAYDFRRAGQRGGENAPPWENKSMWVFYIELATDFLKLTTYLVFFTIILTFYGLPLNIVRDVYMTARSFITRLRALHRYQTATRNMDERYPNATEAEMSAMSDRTCIICREEMILQPPAVPQAPAPAEGPNTTPKKLPCGHIFHFHCLRSWLERQQSCPTCRRTVLEPNPPGNQAPGAAPGAAGGAGAAPPGGGAAQQQPNPFGALGARNQGQPAANNPLGNPLGLVGRLFGPPAQPPIVPGQFIPAGFPQNANNQPHGANIVGQPAGIVIQYHIQYNRQPGQQQVQVPHTPQPLQPAPQFPGFQGPGGVWQPWPQEARNEGQNPPGRVPTAAVPAPSPAAVPVAPTPTPTVEPVRAPSANTEQSGETPSHEPTTAREAAALAALRRMNTGRPAVSRESSTSATPSASNIRPTGTTEANAASSSATDVPANSTLPAPINTPSPSSQRLDIPALIPLYDFHPTTPGLSSNHPGAPQTPNTGSQSPFFRPANPTRGSTESAASTASAHTQTAGAFRGAHTRTASRPASSLSDPRFSQTQSQHASTSAGPLSRLPPTLTDDQLALMDRVTREAIDERLRVLEGVSGAVYRCIDDLMRMRSNFPAAAAATTPVAVPNASTAASSVPSTTTTSVPPSSTSGIPTTDTVFVQQIATAAVPANLSTETDAALQASVPDVVIHDEQISTLAPSSVGTSQTAGTLQASAEGSTTIPVSDALSLSSSNTSSDGTSGPTQASPDDTVAHLEPVVDGPGDISGPDRDDTVSEA